MKIPIIEYNVSNTLQQSYFGKVDSLSQLFEFKESFKIKIKDTEKIILEKISIYSGFNWKQEKITIWFCDNLTSQSISYPLLLNVSNFNIEHAVFSYIHELVHNIFIFANLDGPFLENSNNYDYFQIEVNVNLIAKKVYVDIFGKEKYDALFEDGSCDGYKYGHKYVWKKVLEEEEKIFSKYSSLRDFMLNEAQEKIKYRLKNENI